MACTLTKGRSEPCRDAVGGLKAAYFLDYVEDAFTISSGEATAIDSGVSTVYKYELLGDNNTLVETFTADANNGTSVYEQVLTLALRKQDKDTASEISLIAKARPIVVVEGRDGSFRLVGESDGTVATGDFQSGGAKADFNGINLVLTATETEPAYYLDTDTVTALKNLVPGPKPTT